MTSGQEFGLQALLSGGGAALGAIGQNSIASKDRKVNQQAMLQNLLMQQQQQAMQASQLNPYTQLQAGQNMAMRGELMPNATNAGFNFNPATGMGSFTGGMQIPQGGFSQATQQMFSPDAQHGALDQFQQATTANNPMLDDMKAHLAGASGMTQAPEGMKYDDNGNLKQAGHGGFLGTLGKIAGIAAPIAAMAIPGIGPVASALMMAGGGAAAGAANGGLKGALLGGGAGALSGAGGAIASKVTNNPLLKTAIRGGIGAAAGGMTGGGQGALSGGAMGALSQYVANHQTPHASVQQNAGGSGGSLQAGFGKPGSGMSPVELQSGGFGTDLTKQPFAPQLLHSPGMDNSQGSLNVGKLLAEYNPGGRYTPQAPQAAAATHAGMQVPSFLSDLSPTNLGKFANSLLPKGTQNMLGRAATKTLGPGGIGMPNYAGY